LFLAGADFFSPVLSRVHTCSGGPQRLPGNVVCSWPLTAIYCRDYCVCVRQSPRVFMAWCLIF
jgi:hypothetical protein